MTWNWQRPDWPDVTWTKARLALAERQFLRETGVFFGAVKHVTAEGREQLTVEAISSEALTTSAIEGEILDRASVQSSVRKELGLTTDRKRSAPREQGIAAMTVDLHRRFAEPLSDEMLFAWHAMVMQGSHGIPDIGRYRTSAEPMQVISGRIDAPKVHFEAPPSKKVPAEMKRFIRWFHQTAPGGPSELPALTRAGIAHLYFESIHPFEDGNGRSGRAIAEKAMAQSQGQPTLIALATTIFAHRKTYYDKLEAANKKNEITAWLTWFAAIAIEAQLRTIAQVEFLIDKTHLLDRLRGHLNPRQEKALLRMLQEGPAGFKGGLSASNYASITEASPATTTRDLTDLVDKGALRREGELRHARYHLTIRSSLAD